MQILSIHVWDHQQGSVGWLVEVLVVASLKGCDSQLDIPGDTLQVVYYTDTNRIAIHIPCQSLNQGPISEFVSGGTYA